MFKFLCLVVLVASVSAEPTFLKLKKLKLLKAVGLLGGGHGHGHGGLPFVPQIGIEPIYPEPIGPPPAPVHYAAAHPAVHAAPHPVVYQAAPAPAPVTYTVSAPAPAPVSYHVSAPAPEPFQFHSAPAAEPISYHFSAPPAPAAEPIHFHSAPAAEPISYQAAAPAPEPITYQLVPVPQQAYGAPVPPPLHPKPIGFEITKRFIKL